MITEKTSIPVNVINIFRAMLLHDARYSIVRKLFVAKLALMEGTNLLSMSLINPNLVAMQDAFLLTEIKLRLPTIRKFPQKKVVSRGILKLVSNSEILCELDIGFLSRLRKMYYPMGIYPMLIGSKNIQVLLYLPEKLERNKDIQYLEIIFSGYTAFNSSFIY